MTNFVIVYSGSTMPETEAESNEMMAAWGAWYEKVATSIVDGGNPFSGAKSISSDGVIKDGAVGSHPASGYTVIESDSLDAAMQSVVGHPHLKYGGDISVYETFKM
jgi:hypothetical protein